jgi:hypothetical protein
MLAQSQTQPRKRNFDGFLIMLLFIIEIVSTGSVKTARTGAWRLHLRDFQLGLTKAFSRSRLHHK